MCTRKIAGTPRPRCRHSFWRGSCRSNAPFSIVRPRPTWEVHCGARPSGYNGRGGSAWRRGRSGNTSCTRQVRRQAPNCRVNANAIFVDVVGDRAFLAGGRAPGADEASLAQAAIALARDAGVELLRVYFEPSSDQTPVFLEAGLWIDIAAETVAEALSDRCRGFVHAPRESRSVRMVASAAESA